MIVRHKVDRPLRRAMGTQKRVRFNRNVRNNVSNTPTATVFPSGTAAGVANASPKNESLVLGATAN